mmetsp:Transcript_5262/g.13192  ORF Transcript_5262/g.13192 Transcript_5262/m.13192 type:complete len:244 (+) Transcript_5262:353-1084(+)
MMNRVSAAAKRFLLCKCLKSSPPQAHSVARCNAPGAVQAACILRMLGWPLKRARATRSDRACSRFFGVVREATATDLRANLPPWKVTRWTRPKLPWPKTATALQSRRQSSLAVYSSSVSGSTTLARRTFFFAGRAKRLWSECWRRWDFASAATRPVSCVGDGGLLTTAWRSSSLEAGLAERLAMSAARQRPESQLLLCFMSGNTFRRRVKIFVRPSPFAAAGVPDGVKGALWCAVKVNAFPPR